MFPQGLPTRPLVATDLHFATVRAVKLAAFADFYRPHGGEVASNHFAGARPTC